MNHENYRIITSFLSSSEINRCKKNGLQWYEYHSIKEWNNIFASKWMPRKLRRKFRHLYHCNILPVKVAKYVIGIGDPEIQSLYDEIKLELAKAWVKVEDRIILEGVDKVFTTKPETT